MNEQESSIEELKSKVSELEKKLDSSSEDETSACCCGCCSGLVIGYFLFHITEANGTQIDNYKASKDPTVIVQTIDIPTEQSFLLKQIHNYQTNISPKIKADLSKDRLCKFTPSCSEYARQAIEQYGSLKGSLMTTKRLARCNPLTDGGYDPVK